VELDVVAKGLEKENPPPVVVEAGGLLVVVAVEDAGVAEKGKRFGANDVVDDNDAVVVAAGVAVVDKDPEAKLVNDGAEALVPKANTGDLSDETLVDVVVATGAEVNEPKESVGAVPDVVVVVGAPKESVVEGVGVVVDDDDVAAVEVLLLDNAPKPENVLVLLVVLGARENGFEILVVADAPNASGALDVPNEPKVGALVTAVDELITELSFVVTGTDTDDEVTVEVEVDEPVNVPNEKFGGVDRIEGADVTA